MNCSMPVRDRGAPMRASRRASGYSRTRPGSRGLERRVAIDSGTVHPPGWGIARTRYFLAAGLLIRPGSRRRDVGRVWRSAGYRGGLFWLVQMGAGDLR